MLFGIARYTIQFSTDADLNIADNASDVQDKKNRPLVWTCNLLRVRPGIRDQNSNSTRKDSCWVALIENTECQLLIDTQQDLSF